MTGEFLGDKTYKNLALYISYIRSGCVHWMENVRSSVFPILAIKCRHMDARTIGRTVDQVCYVMHRKNIPFVCSNNEQSHTLPYLEHSAEFYGTKIYSRIFRRCTFCEQRNE